MVNPFANIQERARSNSDHVVFNQVCVTCCVLDVEFVPVCVVPVETAHVLTAPVCVTPVFVVHVCIVPVVVLHVPRVIPVIVIVLVIGSIIICASACTVLYVIPNVTRVSAVAKRIFFVICFGKQIKVLV